MSLLKNIVASTVIAGSLLSAGSALASTEQEDMTPSKSVFMLGVPYGTSDLSDGEYTESGSYYNGAPVYTKQGSGSTVWSLYKRSNGSWVVDFNGVSEDWDGTVAYTVSAQDFPWSVTAWNNDAISFRSEKTYVSGVPYSQYGSNGDYAYTGQVYNDAPVYARVSNGITWSLYKRADGKWYVDFDAVSEAWSGTIAYTTAAAAWPWSATWNASSNVVFNTKGVHVYQAPYASIGSAGEYVFSGTMYNNYPVYQRTGGGYTWSLYKRADGKWYIDFNTVSEAWDGTIAYATAASQWPWDATWNGTAVVFRDASLTAIDNAYWSAGAAGTWSFGGTIYNNAPVYTRAVAGSTWSMYKRANGEWYIDFNAVSEAWDGTVNYRSGSSSWPWTGTWNNGANVSSQFD